MARTKRTYLRGGKAAGSAPVGGRPAPSAGRAAATVQPDGAGRGGSVRQVFVAAAILIALGVLAYANGLQGPFLLDDVQSINDNRDIRQLWPADLLKNPRLPGWVKTPRPVVSLTLAIDYAIDHAIHADQYTRPLVAGEPPPGLHTQVYHATNLVIHILAALTLMGIIGRTLRLMAPASGPRPAGGSGGAVIELSPAGQVRAALGRWSLPLALAVAAIWEVHPLQTGAVTYIVQRGESLMGLCYLLTLYCAIRGIGSGRWIAWIVLSVVACDLGMGCKAVMVTAPLMVILYDLIFHPGRYMQMLRRRWILYVLLCATWGGLAVLLKEYPPGESAGFGMTTMTPHQYALTQFRVIPEYLRLAVLPVNQCLDYGWLPVKSAAEVWPFMLVVLALLGGTCVLLARRHWLGFLGVWFFLILSPTSTFMPIADVIFEHRMYLSLAAVVALAVIGGFSLIHLILTRLQVGQARAQWGALGWVAGIALPVVACLSWATLERNNVYTSELAMWKDVVAKQPNHWRAQNNLGKAYDALGRIPEAMPHYVRAIEINPEYGDAHYNLGVGYGALGEVDKAIAQYKKAIQFKQDFVQAYNNLGVLLSGQGQQALARAQQAGMAGDAQTAAQEKDRGDRLIKEAIGYYRLATKADPYYPFAYNNLATLLAGYGDLDEAIRNFQEAARLKPDYIDVHTNLGVVLLRRGRLDEAIAEYQQALRMKPDLSEAHYGMGLALSLKTQYRQALEFYRAALARMPAERPNLALLNNMARLLAACPQDDIRNGREALALAEQAAKITQDGNADILDTLAAACAETGDLNRAVQLARHVIEMAKAANAVSAMPKYQSHLDTYVAGKPLRETPQVNFEQR